MRLFVFLTLFVAVFLFPINIIAQELVLYYPFEGDGDEVTDQSGNENDGEFDTGAAIRVPSKDADFGKAMEFDGASRITVEDSDSLQIDTELSFVMWVKKSGEGGTGLLPRIISGASDVHELAMDTGHMVAGNFAIYFGGNPGWTTVVPVDEEWHHIALTADGSEFHVYLDGEDVFELQAGVPKTFTGTIYIGSRHDLGSAEFYLGLLDELAMYAGVLTQDQVQDIMEAGVLGDLLAVSPHDRLGSTWGKIKAKY